MLINVLNCISSVVVTSSVADCWYEPWLGQTKDYKIGIFFFSAKYATIKE